MAENTKLIHRKGPLEILFFDHDRAEYRNLPAYMVFDDAYRRKGPIASTLATYRELWGGPVGYPVVHNVYGWSDDNQAEIDEGWVFQADTLAGLAKKLGMEPAALEASVRILQQRLHGGARPAIRQVRKVSGPIGEAPLLRRRAGAYPGQHPGRPQAQ